MHSKTETPSLTHLIEPHFIKGGFLLGSRPEKIQNWFFRRGIEVKPLPNLFRPEQNISLLYCTGLYEHCKTPDEIKGFWFRLSALIGEGGTLILQIPTQQRLSARKRLNPEDNKEFYPRHLLRQNIVGVGEKYQFLCQSSSLETDFHWFFMEKKGKVLFKEKQLTPKPPPPKRKNSLPLPQGPLAMEKTIFSLNELPLYIDSEENLCDQLEKIPQTGAIGLDIETTLGKFPTICTLQLAWGEKVLVIDTINTWWMDPLKPLLENPNLTKVCHNAPFESRFLRNNGISLNGVFDTLSASRKLRGDRFSGGHGLKDVCLREFGIELDKTLQISQWNRRPLSQAQLIYAAADAILALKLYFHFAPFYP